MTPLTRSLILSAALACAWAAAPATAQTPPKAEAPLAGAAWQFADEGYKNYCCLLYTSPSPRDS